jgi:hypothetical protein
MIYISYVMWVVTYSLEPLPSPLLSLYHHCIFEIDDKDHNEVFYNYLIRPTLHIHCAQSRSYLNLTHPET